MDLFGMYQKHRRSRCDLIAEAGYFPLSIGLCIVQGYWVRGVLDHDTLLILLRLWEIFVILGPHYAEEFLLEV